MSERAFSWEDTVQNDSTFEVLPEGDYDFTVKAFERAYHDGSAACQGKSKQGSQVHQ